MDSRPTSKLLVEPAPGTLNNGHESTGTGVATAKATPVKQPTLRANFSWTLASNVVYAACQWGILTILARLGSPEIVGQYALGLAVTAPIFIFSTLKLRSVQATDARGEYQFGDYLALRLATSALALLVVAVLVLFSHYRRETALVILIIALVRIFDGLSDIIYGLLLQHEWMQRIAISRIVQGLLQLFCAGVAVILTHNILWVMISLAVGSAVVTVAYDIRSVALVRARANLIKETVRREPLPAVRFAPRWDMRTLQKLTWLALPLAVTITLGSLWTNIPRYFMHSVVGDKGLGIFAVVGSLMVVSSTVIVALGQTASPRLAKYAAAGDWRAFDRLVLRLVCLGIVLGAGGLGIVVAAGRPILSTLYGAHYADQAATFAWLMAAAGLQNAYVFLGSAIISMRNFSIQAPIQTISIIITTILCAFLIPQYVYRGAAWAMLGANIFEMCAYTAAFRYVRKKCEALTPVSGSPTSC